MNGLGRTSWQHVRDRIHAWILDQTVRPGERLPTDEEIAARFGCARTTVHRAMRALAERGIVERRTRAGTTVARSAATRTVMDIPVTRLEIESFGAAYAYRLIDLKRGPAPPDLAKALGLSSGEAMLNVRALHLADGRPHLYEDRWISLATVPEIRDVDLSRESANEWLVNNRPYSRCDVRICARSCSPIDARLLDVNDGDAILVIERKTWIGDAPITMVQAMAEPNYHLTATTG